MDEWGGVETGGGIMNMNGRGGNGGREGSVEKELREDLEYECNGGKDRGKRGPWRRDYAGI